jgi:hypothetical protein
MNYCGICFQFRHELFHSLHVSLMLRNEEDERVCIQPRQHKQHKHIAR